MEPEGKRGTVLNPSNENSSHALMVEFVGREKRVLDVGAGSGDVVEALCDRGCEVAAVELDPDAARQVGKFCETVVVGDVETLDLQAELDGESFDVIVFGDVLEHLREPGRTLERLKPFLRAGGYVVASIPNVAHGSVRLALLQGRFRYQPLGLLDDTHLRFFTRESVEQLFEEAGFTIGELGRTRRDVFDTEVEVNRELFTGEMLGLLESDPESRTYQFVLTAHPAGEDGALTKLSNRVRLLEDRLSRREEQVRALEAGAPEAKKLRQELDATGRQLAARDRKIDELRRRLRHLAEMQHRLDVANRQLDARQEEVSNLTREVANRTNRLTNKEKMITRLQGQLEQLRAESR